jgi:hypothetical protein
MAKYEAAASEMAELKLAIAKLQDTAVEADAEEKTVKATKKSKKSAE